MIITVSDSMHQAITFLIWRKDEAWCYTSIFASHILNLRIRLWDYLSQQRNIVHVPWLLVGDLNEILFSSKVYGRNFYPTQASHLAHVMT